MKRKSRVLPNLYLTLILLIMYLPMVVVVVYSFNTQPKGLMWTGFTTQWYPKMFENRQLMSAMKNSLIVAVWSCLISAGIGTMGAFGLARVKWRGKGLFESTATLPIMLPEIVLGLALMTTFSLMNLGGGLITLVIAHTTFCIPYVLILVGARLAGLDPAYEEAARDLGASGMRAFLTVTLPLIFPAVLSGVLISFAMSLDDVVISFFVSGAEATTYPVYVYGKLKTDIPPTINCMCTLMLGVMFMAVALSQLMRSRRAARVRAAVN